MSKWSITIVATLLATIGSMSVMAQAHTSDKRAELEQSFQYSDASQCHTKSPDGKDINIVNQLVAAHHLPTIDGAQVMIALQEAVKRQCNMNERDKAGLTPLAAAVLFNDAEIVDFLLKHGAEIDAKIERAGSAVDGMNVSEFLDYILQREAQAKQPVDRSPIQALIARVKQKNSPLKTVDSSANDKSAEAKSSLLAKTDENHDANKEAAQTHQAEKNAHK